MCYKYTNYANIAPSIHCRNKHQPNFQDRQSNRKISLTSSKPAGKNCRSEIIPALDFSASNTSNKIAVICLQSVIKLLSIYRSINNTILKGKHLYINLAKITNMLLKLINATKIWTDKPIFMLGQLEATTLEAS